MKRALLAMAVWAAGSLAMGAAPAPSVDSIIADYVAARGGLAKIKAVQSLRQTGHAHTDGGRHAIVMRELKRPDKTRFEFTVQGITNVFVANGKEGWQVAPLDGDLEAKPMSEQAVVDALEQADIEGPLVDWKAKGHRIELAGRDKVGDREAHKLKVTLASGAIRYDYIDVKTHQELRMDSTREVRGQTVSLTTTFGGYKKTAGLLFPGTVEVTAIERPQKLRIVVDKIEVNPKIDDARFERAKPAR
jgi:outer membrane lipoprotein-sorting protein